MIKFVKGVVVPVITKTSAVIKKQTEQIQNKAINTLERTPGQDSFVASASTAEKTAATPSITASRKITDATQHQTLVDYEFIKKEKLFNDAIIFLLQPKTTATGAKIFTPNQTKIINLAAKVSGGNPAIVEQMVMLYKDIKRNKLKHVSYNSAESIVDARLGILRQEDYQSYRMLVAMSILGSKFYPAMLEHFDNISPKEFERVIETLVQHGFISQLNNLSFEFKSKNIWKIICTLK